MSIEEIREFIGSDSLAFLSINSLKKLLGNDSPNFCYACVSGKYPVEPGGEVKRVGDFLDDGLSGNMESINGAGLKGLEIKRRNAEFREINKRDFIPKKKCSILDNMDRSRVSNQQLLNLSDTIPLH